MVRDEYPAPEEEVKEEEMVQEIVQTQENNQNNVNEQMDVGEDEDYSNGIGRSLEYDVFSDDISAMDIKALEDQLDYLQIALDHLEKKNDNIRAELIDLLQSNREARKQFRESLEQYEVERQQTN
ncbi:PREDICTED: UPF0184 protein C9orf16 homolog isoform X1 [Dinoponera quadriceps]|uniref:UPF0184 protein C9orf16 homolog isoform X1 n=1 Tax=Dinoponera quadriceps TaxID=609295 RepID=A0A6P3Y0W3_DINQU|nr:PREDICTED: UPF0184 protein C9orf16 homolog isoform X1 [Dinoponera quadriceps]XP_014484451.1 PREDICTED: UPF0184 protein C9orf16 homolog isoform X1 [Dinoponera quadriceps]